VEGRALAGGIYQFALSSAALQVCVVSLSRAGVQSELGLARDPRLLGVALRRIMLWRGAYG
jgi:hypothetical protein